MSYESIQDFLLVSLGVNYVVLIGWFAIFVLAHDGLYRLHTRWFRLTVERFDALHYGGMAVYKIGILLLNLAPLIALWLMGRP